MERTAKIMVVDDEMKICQNVEKILSKSNYEVVHAQSAKEALEKMAKDSFSLLISDIVMPEMNGLELLKLAKDQWPLTKVMMMTAYASTDTAVKAIRLGALDYVPKPFTPDELRSKVERVLTGELVEASTTGEERESIEVIDVDIPFERDEVAKYTGEDYADMLGPSDMPVIEEPAPETLINYCLVGEMVCDIFKKLGNTCKGGVKSSECPQKKAKEKKAAKAKMEKGFYSNDQIGIDQPFNYEEVASVTSPEYVQNLQQDGFSFLPYEELKKNVARLMAKEPEKAPVSLAAKRPDAKKLIGIDQPFNYEEVAAVTGPEYVQNLHQGGMAFLPYEELKKNVSQLMAKQPETAPAYHEVMQEPTHKNILVIDDEVAVNNNIRKILAKKGYHVDQAVTKSEALQKIEERAYKLVLLDLRIPGVKGLELLEAIRDKGPDTKVIIITGYASIETAVETARLGAIDYVAKPFTPEEIRHATEDALRLAA